MATEEKPLPKIALRSLETLAEVYGREVQVVAVEILDGMGLSPADGWRVNVATRVAFREVAE